MSLARTLARTLPRTALPVLAVLVVAAAMGVGVPSPAGAAAPVALVATAAQQASTPVLRTGSQGLAVREWQSLVNRALTGRTVAHPVLVVDGTFGARTASATRAVQAAAGLVQDGVVGPATRAALPGLLPGSTGTPPAPHARRLSTGSLGGDVVDWQRTIGHLASVGEIRTPRPALDGVFGPATRAGTLAVQRRLGVTQDGVAGPVTRAGADALVESSG